MRPDLTATRQALLKGQQQALQVAEACLDMAQSAACQHVFRQITPDSFRKEATQTPAARPLAGLAVSVKDLFDVQGQITAAGSTILENQPPASQDAVAIARLRAAGAGFIGRTHMVEFAFSGVGINPHHGTPAAWDARTNSRAGSTPGAYAPGGSSSGAAVSVATGAAFIGLGSDTGGSIRIPAALNGIVGFKNTARRVPTHGAVPLSTTLDTVCAMTRSARDAVLAHEILSARKVAISTRPLSSYRLAVAKNLMLDDMDSTVTRAFERSLKNLRAAGAQIEEIDLPELLDLAPMMATGGFSPAESYAWHRHLLTQHADQYDPRVAHRIGRGAHMSAHDYIHLLQARKDWMDRMDKQLQRFDAVLSPTTPITAPLISSVAPGAERDAEFFRVNALLLRNPSAINVLDGCAISLPCHAPGELPVGLMAWHGAMHDDTILQLSLLLEPWLQTQ
ncbi:amidase [Limnohabitans sp. DCL3]|uniref:amidase n=1 Tax=Limnohabitans sp. DCL3 TaxID=3374103 RepID=UPI003A8A2156